MTSYQDNALSSLHRYISVLSGHPQLPGSLEEGQNALPVMVFIHGGAYMSGDAFLYVPTKLMDKDVVVVVVQYRLGLLGTCYTCIKATIDNF